MMKLRLDELLAKRGIFDTPELARGSILAGDVRVDDQTVTKAGERYAEDVAIKVAPRPRFVSRGGEKLAGALDAFGFDPSGLRCVDVGASTGGFTDCLLQRGAASVCAVDVGYGQLAWSLRSDPRVSVFERTNIRHVEPEKVGAPFDLAVADVSFIPLRAVLPSIIGLLDDEGVFITLVKPQFEVSKNMVGEKGVVREASSHIMVLENVVDAFAQNGLQCTALAASPITGPEGNIEFLLMAKRSGEPVDLPIAEIVMDAHRRLGGSDADTARTEY